MTLRTGTHDIESERLVLRRIVGEDLDVFTKIHADPEVARYIGSGNPRSNQETLQWLQDTLMNYERYELGQLAVLRKSDRVLIGRCGLGDVAVESGVAEGRTLPRGWFSRSQAPEGIELVFEPELGYTFGREFWGFGYASEAAGCVFNYVKQIARLPKVISVIHPENVRSIRLAEKLGCRRSGCVEMLARSFDRYLWPIDTA